MLSPEETLEEVVVTPQRAFPPLPDLRVIERPGWLQIVTPSITNGSLNEVIHAALSQADADATIDATIAAYRALGLKFRWRITPLSAPLDLGERLARRGLTWTDGFGMARSTEADLSADPSIRVVEVDASTLATFSATAAAGWAQDLAHVARINTQVFACAPRHQHMFLAYVDGAPAATASYVPFARSAYLIGGVTVPAFRGRGLYRALVLARLAHARARGLSLATTHARGHSSAPILERLGFAKICSVAMYVG